MSSPVGTLLDARYRIDAVVGAGGMSTVYRAFDTVLERPVAIKLMHREIARRLRPAGALPPRGARRRAAQPPAHRPDHRRRARKATGTPPYIVFEYVEGETLKARIKRLGRLPVPESLAYAIEIARALHAAHARHIVHRDVKPQNVLIDAEGSAQGHRLRHRPHARRGRPDLRRPRAGHDRLRLARAGARPSGRPASPTSTRSASCSSRCSPGTSRSTARTRSPSR